MATAIPHEADEGTRVTIDLNEDVSAAVSAKILAKKPDGTVLEWVATVDGETVYYDIPASILVEGRWYFQAWVDLTAWKGHSMMHHRDVGGRLVVT